MNIYFNIGSTYLLIKLSVTLLQACWDCYYSCRDWTQST